MCKKTLKKFFKRIKKTVLNLLSPSLVCNLKDVIDVKITLFNEATNVAELLGAIIAFIRKVRTYKKGFLGYLNINEI